MSDVIVEMTSVHMYILKQKHLIIEISWHGMEASVAGHIRG